MSAGKVLEFNDSSTSNTIMSIGQTGLNLNSLLITNLADALNDNDALNRQTADARYEPLASGAILSKNGIDFTNDAEIVIQGDMSSAKPITFTDSSSSLPKLSIQ